MIKCAKQSPRVCGDNTIRWYEGDTFQIELNFTKLDNNGNTLSVEETDVFAMTIVNKQKEVIHEIEVTGTNTIVIDMTEELTAKFTKGTYFYDVELRGEYITTVVNENKLVVE